MTDDMTADETIAFDGILAAQRLASKTARDARWYRNPVTGEEIKRNFGEVIALMHSELSEALEADRKGLKDDKLTHRDGREVEFADCIIRILDTAEALGLDVAGAFIEKTDSTLHGMITSLRRAPPAARNIEGFHDHEHVRQDDWRSALHERLVAAVRRSRRRDRTP